MFKFIFTKTPLFFLIQPIWRDEAFSYFMAKKNIIDIIRLTSADFNPPLYYLLLKIWINIFGSSEIALRSLSLMFFWAIIYIAFLFYQNIFKVSFKKNLFFLTLLITNPVIVYYAFEARMYTLFGFFTIASYYFFLKKNDKAYLIFSLLGLYTHYFMIFIILSQILSSFFKKSLKKDFFRYYLYILIGYFPWLITIFAINKNFNNQFWILIPKNISFLNFLGIFYLGYEMDIFPKEQLPIIFKTIQNLSLIITVFILLSFIFNKNKVLKNKNIVTIIIWGLIMPILIYLISFFKPIFLSRYLISFIIGLIILITYLLDKLKNNFLFYSLIILIVFFSFKYQSYQIKYRRKKNILPTVKEINFLAKKGDFIYVEDILDYFPVAYYLGENRTYIYHLPNNDYEKIPQYIGKVLILKEKVKKLITVYPKKTFILKTDGNYEIKTIY